MNRKPKKKLALDKKTLKRLEDDKLDDVAGGMAGGAGKAVTQGTTAFPCFSQNNCPNHA